MTYLLSWLSASTTQWDRTYGTLDIEKYVDTPSNDKLDRKLLRIIADDIDTPICHIFNLSLLESVCTQARRAAKVIPLPTNSKAPPLLAQIADQSARYQPLVNFWKKMCVTR